MTLFEFDRPVTEIKGIGEQKKTQLQAVQIQTVSDLLLWFPRNYEDRTHIIPFASVKEKGFVVTQVSVLEHQYFRAMNKMVLKIIVRDATSKAELVCFGRNFLAKQFPPGSTFKLAGTFTRSFNTLQATQFDTQDFDCILPIYSRTRQLTQNFFRKAIQNALNTFLKTIDEDLPVSVLQQFNLLSIQKTLTLIHQPTDFDALKEALRSFKFREFYHFQKEAQERKNFRNQIQLDPLISDTLLQNRFLSTLPFDLSPDQKAVIKTINSDLALPHPMARLLQGDVGSGKTLVATAAAVTVIANHRQVAFLAPTELLAQQHAEKLSNQLIPLGIKMALLTGSLSIAARKPLLQALKEGEIDIVIGTHALFSSSVEFHNLSLVIIDEQHKFGVNQREAMKAKGYHPHTLLMSATPIPRTLAQTLYADLALSEIRTLPQGRLPIITHLALQENRNKVLLKVLEQLEQGHQAYFVYPRIADDEIKEDSFDEMMNQSPLLSATDSFRSLSQTAFRHYHCGLLTSETPEEEKELLMQQFNNGTIQVLFATTIVEVGIDNPNATIIVIENANQFGLAQLHQLRGRVGRGALQSYCFLVYPKSLTEEAKQRLIALKNTNDGFLIAQEDLKIRGPGELLGLRQAGQFPFQLADPNEDAALLSQVLIAIQK